MIQNDEDFLNTKAPNSDYYHQCILMTQAAVGKKNEILSCNNPFAAVAAIAQGDITERIQTHAHSHTCTGTLWKTRFVVLLCQPGVVYSSVSRTLKTPWTDSSLWTPEAGIQLAWNIHRRLSNIHFHSSLLCMSAVKSAIIIFMQRHSNCHCIE